MCILLLSDFLFNFNSIKVRLEHLSHNDVFSCAPFQFHKGTIRTKYEDADGMCRTNFNSIKVRLEQAPV